MSSDLMSLHIGDRILEVNGTPVKEQPIESIENLIRYSDTVLQVNYPMMKTENNYSDRTHLPIIN